MWYTLYCIKYKNMSLQDIIMSMKEFGYVGLFLIIFLESFPMTFFLPGDSLLFTTGFLASQGFFSLNILVSVFFLAGTIGYILSYYFGQMMVKKIFTNEKSKIFNPKHIVTTHNFYEKYGAKTIIIGRFIPVVRSFGPSFAGVGDMTFAKFFTYTLAGGVLWAGGVTSLGFYLGRILPKADALLTPIVLGIVFISILPTIYEYLKEKYLKQKITDKI